MFSKTKKLESGIGLHFANLFNVWLHSRQWIFKDASAVSLWRYGACTGVCVKEVLRPEGVRKLVWTGQGWRGRSWADGVDEAATRLASQPGLPWASRVLLHSFPSAASQAPKYFHGMF